MCLMDDATVQRTLARPYSLACRMLPPHTGRLAFLPKYPDFTQQHCYRDFSFTISGGAYGHLFHLWRAGRVARRR